MDDLTQVSINKIEFDYDEAVEEEEVEEEEEEVEKESSAGFLEDSPPSPLEYPAEETPQLFDQINEFNLGIHFLSADRIGGGGGGIRMFQKLRRMRWRAWRRIFFIIYMFFSFFL